MRQISDKVRRIRAAQAKLIAKDEEERAELTPSERFYERVLRQVQSEYTVGWRFMQPKIQEWLKRLKLYNNQLRDKDKVGDPLIYTIFQSVFAFLWNDRLEVEFGGREEGDDDMAENLNGLAVYDYDEMDKAQHDHDWNWDAMAFGRGYSYFNEFDVDSKTPIPQVWDPLTVIRDPDAISVHGDRLGNGAMSFLYREVLLSKAEMKKNPQYFNFELLQKDKTTISYSPLFQAIMERNLAQNRQTQVARAKDSDMLKVLQGFMVIDGEKHIVEIGNNNTLLIRLEPLEGSWPLIDRSFSPMAHDWDGVSIFDILEDKQRFRAALLNVIGESARADVYPMRLFDKTKIRKEIDKNYGFNKWIPVEGPVGDAERALSTGGSIAKAQFVLDFLDVSSQRAMAVPEFQQGAISSEKRTLGELQLVASKAEGRHSLSARIFGLSEKKFWKRWYEIYDRDFSKGLGKKSIRLMGAFGPKWREIGRDEIIVSHPLGPDIKIESKMINEAVKQKTYINLKDYYQFAFQYPDTDKLYGLRKLGRLFAPKDEVERLLPLSIDERQAREENEKLNENELQPVSPEEDHNVHLREHAGAKDTPALRQHIKAHEYALMQKRIQPDLFPMLPSEMGMAGEKGELPSLVESQPQVPRTQ